MAGNIKEKGTLEDLADFLLQAMLPGPEGGLGALDQEAIALAPVAEPGGAGMPLPRLANAKTCQISP
jgi:hypothetical protein